MTHTETRIIDHSCTDNKDTKVIWHDFCDYLTGHCLAKVCWFHKVFLQCFSHVKIFVTRQSYRSKD